MSIENAFLSLGSNIGDPIENLRNALDHLQLFYDIRAVSSPYRSISILKDNQPDYFNIAVSIKTDKTPLEVLHINKKIESDMGRIKTKKWGARVIDIDIADYGGLVLSYPELILPHKDMTERSFVLLPIREIFPQYIHPVTKKSVEEMIIDIK
ncbi:MAG: 2-amino-4-hydroxy-6-hydroxymethyldihydropteridine diphosphokinase, partial [Mucispirillum sp.]|nr:2-amino-4-hydroxy-6-hydroxymethyldihydropteridine diphosphokinase [Mucispirillum sp.]